MKRLAQFVAQVIVAVLAVSPSFAEGFCQMLEPTVQNGMFDCCVSMGRGDMNPMPAHSSMPTAVQAQSCNDGCCTVTQQTLLFQAATDKVKSDTAPVTHVVVATLEAQSRMHVFPSLASADNLPAPRHILLRTLRI
jgi:hypothetical protein